MKRTFLLSLQIIIFLISYSCSAQSTKENRATGLSETGKVEVYYFHYTRRCATCLAVESEAKKIIDELFSQALIEEKIAFHSLNLEEEEGGKVAEQLNISGQTLLVVRDGKQFNLTNEGFMYARTSPDKFREAMQDAIGEI